ncbi:MAG: polysaccharide biosynthesis C-terminal domain-containing protein [Bacteroidales bacterium]|jgi:O-antigen/teichoic acid export membrane protein
MFKNLLGTITTRFIIAVINFIIILLTSRELGPEKYGTISLIILVISFVLIFGGFIGSASLVYMASRYDLFKLFVISYVWTFISSVLVTAILYFLNLIPSGFAVSVLFLSLIRTLTEVNQTILLGKEKIAKFNSITLIQTIITLVVIIYLFLIIGKKEVTSYIISIYIAYIISFIISFIYIFKDLKYTDFKGIDKIVKEVFKFGLFVQTSNIIQQLNYRLSYYIVDSFLGRYALGVFTLGVQLSESIWIISKSMATVLYARISNSSDAEYSKNITIRFAKISFLISLFCIIVLLIIPENIFILIFRKEFGGMKNVIAFLSIGILSVATSTMFGHYYSGTGKPHFNTMCSIIGLVFTLTFGFVLIPELGITGAAMTSTFSYFASFMFSLVIFINITKTKYRELFVLKDDFKLIIQEIKKFKNKN